jgi:hypothetical protein
LTLVEICPPLRVLQPKPASSASSTSVSRPPRAVCSAALSPVYPDPMIATSTFRGSGAAGRSGRGT